MIDYRGQRLIAISLLPINKKTLMYGTADSGNTIVTDPSVQPIVENIAKQVYPKKKKKIIDLIYLRFGLNLIKFLKLVLSKLKLFIYLVILKSMKD